jgi:uncharacterized protein (DUF1015 family)
MPEIGGFRGVRYQPAQAGDLDQIITPPYDVITPAERAALAARSPHNLVHLILPEDQPGLDRYTSARQALESWQASGVLARDPEESYYLFQQTFTDLAGATRVRRGFFAVVRLPEAGERTILGHERTFAKPVEDRLRLTEATAANLEPVFSLYADPDGYLSGFLDQMHHQPGEALAHTIDGVDQVCWRVEADPLVADFLRDQTLYIADGHHRFQTACTYRDARRRVDGFTTPQPYDYVMMGLVAFEDPGLEVYAAHRLVPFPPGFDLAEFFVGLEPWFEVAPVTGDLLAAVNAAPAACAIGMAVHGAGDFLLSLRDIDRVDFLGDDHGASWRDLDVAVLHRGIIECTLRIPEGAQFGYEKDVHTALAAAHKGDVGFAFVLRPTRKDQIRACAEAGEAMPQKSTYFFPKLASGLVMNLLR